MSVTEKFACIFDNPTSLSVLRATGEHAPWRTHRATADRAHECGDAVYIAVHRVRIDDHHGTVASFGHDHEYIQQASKTTPTMCRSRL